MIYIQFYYIHAFLVTSGASISSLELRQLTTSLFYLRVVGISAFKDFHIFSRVGDNTRREGKLNSV